MPIAVLGYSKTSSMRHFRFLEKRSNRTDMEFNPGDKLPMKLIVRTAHLDDANAIAPLLLELGYEVDVEQVRSRLQNLLQSSRHVTLLAEANDLVAGLCLVCNVMHLASAGYAEVLELVVQTSLQRQGIGSLLLRHAQTWAAGQGQFRVRLRSGVHRAEAHRFYERLGYTKSRASHAFERVGEATIANELLSKSECEQVRGI